MQAEAALSCPALPFSGGGRSLFAKSAFSIRTRLSTSSQPHLSAAPDPRFQAREWPGEHAASRALLVPQADWKARCLVGPRSRKEGFKSCTIEGQNLQAAAGWPSPSECDNVMRRCNAHVRSRPRLVVKRGFEWCAMGRGELFIILAGLGCCRTLRRTHESTSHQAQMSLTHINMM